MAAGQVGGAFGVCAVFAVNGMLLSLIGIGKAHRRSRSDGWVLRNVSLDVDVGEMVAVIATRGQGKSTLLRIAGGMERPDAGRVLFEGRDFVGLGDR